MIRPTSPTTPKQRSTIGWASILLFASLGTIGMLFYLRAPAEKADQAAQLLWYSLAFWGLAAIIYGGRRIAGYFLD